VKIRGSTTISSFILANLISSQALSDCIQTAQKLTSCQLNTNIPYLMPRKNLLPEIAEELDWQPTDDPNNLCQGVFYVPQYLKDHPIIDKSAPIEITAQGPELVKFDGVSVLQNHVVITQPGRMVFADKAFIFRDGQTHKITKIVLVGHTKVRQRNSLLVGDKSIITFYPKTIDVKNAVYHLYSDKTNNRTIHGPFNAWGIAETGHQDSERVLVLRHATYTTCSPVDVTWSIWGSKLVLDKQHNIGKAYNAVLKIHKIPILYYPYYTFQLNNERKTGFLMPMFGYIKDPSSTPDLSKTGFYVDFPYYINLAPNYDLLLTPEYYGERGFRLIGQFRYITHRSHGNIYASVLPNDKSFARFRNDAINTYSNPLLTNANIYPPYVNALKNEGNARGFIAMQNDTQFNRHWYSYLFLNLVTDPYYFADIIVHNFGSTTVNQLLNLFVLQYTSNYWDIYGFIQAYQTLNLITQVTTGAQALDQYRRLPGLNATGYFPLTDNTNFELFSDYTNFTYNSLILSARPTGQRLHLRPGFTYSWQTSAAYIKPQIWLDAVGYQLSNTVPGIRNSQSRVLPIGDVEAGLHILRNFEFDNESFTQTLEPKLFYLYIPYTQQNNLPNFDTIQLPFYFNQLFALNTFEGVDRLENANQLSYGLTSSIVRDQNGQKILIGNIGEIYYFTNPKVCLIPGCKITQRSVSPIASDLTFNPSPIWSFTGAFAWDPVFHNTNLASATLGYHQDGHRVINVSYAFVGANPNSLATFDAAQPNALGFYSGSSHLILSTAWPVSPRWTTLSFSDYNYTLRRLDGLYAGIQYDSCCYAFRFLVKHTFFQQVPNTSGGLHNVYETGYLIEFTLKGLASFGSASDAFIQGKIAGYQP